jgi:hypothetical protein
VQVRNTGQESVEGSATVDYVGQRVRLQETPIPLRVLNHALKQLLLGLAIAVRLDGSHSRISLAPDVTGALGLNDRIPFDVPDVVQDINMKTFTATARPGVGSATSRPGPSSGCF